MWGSGGHDGAADQRIPYLVGCWLWEGCLLAQLGEGLSPDAWTSHAFYPGWSVGAESLGNHLGGKTCELGRSVLGLSLDTPEGHPRVLPQSPGGVGLTVSCFLNPDTEDVPSPTQVMTDLGTWSGVDWLWSWRGMTQVRSQAWPGLE